LPKLIGGCFAPALAPEKVSDYRQLAATVQDKQVAQYMSDLCDMLELFYQTPESTEASSKHAIAGMVTPLADNEVQRIWDKVPWPEECDLIGKAFDRLPAGDVRNAAYHLLWYARELTQDREPMTKERAGLT
jgi:hypothetical protein